VICSPTQAVERTDTTLSHGPAAHRQIVTRLDTHGRSGTLMKRMIASLCGFFIVGIALLAQSIDLQAYSKCTGFALSTEPPPPEAVQTCLNPARQGLPGAQYALAAILLAQSKSGPPPDAIEWLEKAVRAGHPPAAHLLAAIYLRSGQQDLQARGRELLKFAVCSGYPPAQTMRSIIVSDNAQLDCAGSGPVSFNGTWTSSLKWVQQSPVLGSAPELRLTLSNNEVKIYMHSGQEWIEVKPGKFEVRQADDTLVISTLDSGWDLDGKWVESWTIHLLRLSDKEALINFVRTVNNLHMPAASTLKVLTSVAEGKAIRSGK
jgi:hypothetical protein